MAVEVEIQVFPGLPNPRYMLAASDEGEFRNLLRNLPPAALLGAPVPTRTGYRGLWVRVIDDHPVNERELHVFGGRVSGGETILIDDGRQLERRLFENAPGAVRERAQLPFDRLIAEGVHDQEVEGLESLGKPGECPGALPFPTSPPETIWDKKRTSNNCYNFALDLPASNWALPGGISHALPCSTLIALVQRDGPRHLPNGFDDLCAPNAHLLVLCLVNPSEFTGNFHFLRLDRGGVWSHKFGPLSVTNRDDASREMTDLASARFNYRLVVCAAFEYVRPERPPIILA